MNLYFKIEGPVIKLKQIYYFSVNPNIQHHTKITKDKRNTRKLIRENYITNIRNKTHNCHILNIYGLLMYKRSCYITRTNPTASPELMKQYRNLTTKKKTQQNSTLNTQTRRTKSRNLSRILSSTTSLHVQIVSTSRCAPNKEVHGQLSTRNRTFSFFF